MKSLYFTEEHELFRQSVRQFVQKEILPFADQWEKEEKIDRALFKKLGEHGFLGINHEEAYGGSKADIFYTCAYLEELAKCGYAGVCAAVFSHRAVIKLTDSNILIHEVDFLNGAKCKCFHR